MFKSTPLFVGLILLLNLSSCVSKKNFLELQSEKDYLALQMEKTRMDLQSQITKLSEQNVVLERSKETLNENIVSLGDQLNTTEEKMKTVEFSLKEKQYQISQLWNEMDVAFSGVEEAVATSNTRIKELENFLYLDLDDVPEFGSGSDKLDLDDSETLTKIASMLNSNPAVTMVIEGHTDSRPISNDKYRDNWDLSVSRATQIVRKLEEMGVNPKQLIPSGRGEYLPKTVEDKDNPQTLADNRRTEFIIVPNIGKLYKVYKNQTEKVINP